MSFIQENLPFLLAGISVGGQYALIAIGYTMVYGILRLINFAHGDVFMVAGLVMVYAATALPLYISIPLVIILTVILGVAIEKVAYKPLRTAPRMSVMISAIGVSYLLQNLALYVTGGLFSDPRPVCQRHHRRRVHQVGHHHHPHPDHHPGGHPHPAHQPHQDRYGHAGGLP